MGKLLSVSLFTLLSELYLMVTYCFASEDLSRIAYAGPVVGAVMGSAMATLSERLWSRLRPFYRCVIYSAIAIVVINVATTFYQCLAEQITYDHRIFRPQAEYTSGAWGDDPWMMYPELSNLGYGEGMANLTSNLLLTVQAVGETSFIWLPVVLLISWLSTRTYRKAPHSCTKTVKDHPTVRG